MYKINKRGQSTVEYILLVAAVIAVVIAFTANQNTGVQGQLNTTLNAAYTQVDDMASRYVNAEPTTNGSSPASQVTVNILQ